jgi:type II secretory pathway component GspD/PulD (secretin)
MTKVLQLKHTNPTNLVSIVKPTLTDKRSNVTFDGRTSKLIVVATEAELNAVDALVETLDQPTRQVLIEARIYETSRNPNSVKGVNWAGTFQGQNVSFGNGNTVGVIQNNNISGGVTSAGPLPTSGEPGTLANVAPGTGSISSHQTINNLVTSVGSGGLSLNTARGFNPVTAFLNADGVNAVVSFLNSDSESEVLATPRAVTLDNEKATLSVTRAFPIINVTPGSANSPAGSQILYTNLGTILEVTPRISANDKVALHIVPEVSSLDGKDQQTINGQLSVANIYAIRKIEANVVIPSAHTLVMGGLISDSKNKTSTKVPILGDAPGLGAFFRHKSNDHKKSNLLIFVTPTIIADTDFQGTPTDFLKSPLPESPALPKGWWRTTDPHPWTEQQQQQQQSGGQQ